VRRGSEEDAQVCYARCNVGHKEDRKNRHEGGSAPPGHTHPACRKGREHTMRKNKCKS